MMQVQRPTSSGSGLHSSALNEQRNHQWLFEVLHRRRRKQAERRRAYLLGSVAHEDAGADSLSERSHAAYDDDTGGGGGGSSSLPLGPTNTSVSDEEVEDDDKDSSIMRSCSDDGFIGLGGVAGFAGLDSGSVLTATFFSVSSLTWPKFFGTWFSFSAEAGPRLAAGVAAPALLLRGRSGSLFAGVVVAMCGVASSSRVLTAEAGDSAAC